MPRPGRGLARRSAAGDDVTAVDATPAASGSDAVADAVVTLSRRQVTDLLGAHGLAPRRSLGQNFVVDPNTARRVARLARVGAGDRVVEIGAGLGALTLALAETGASVTAVEVDRGLVPLLRARVEPAGVRVVEGDALELDWAGLLGPARAPSASSAPSPSPSPASSPASASASAPASASGGTPRLEHPDQAWSLVANLPYNVATPLIVTLLEGVPAIARMLVMVQAEVGERLAASVGGPLYGAVSVLVAYWSVARVVGKVPPTVFVPRPNVDSALVSIERRPVPAVVPDAVPYARVKEVVRAGFAHRRKMLRQSLSGVVDPAAFEAAGVAPEARAEDLDVTAWGRLAGWR